MKRIVRDHAISSVAMFCVAAAILIMDMAFNGTPLNAIWRTYAWMWVALTISASVFDICEYVYLKRHIRHVVQNRAKRLENFNAMLAARRDQSAWPTDR